MSKQWENRMAKEVHRATESDTRAYRCGYSGSNAMPMPDVLVTTPTVNYAMELKGPIQSERVYVDEEDLEQLVECTNSYTIAFLVIKFTYREPLLVRYYDEVVGFDEWNEMSVVERFAALTPPCFNARVTDSGRLAMDKPSTDDWASSTVGRSDVEAIVNGLAVE